MATSYRLGDADRERLGAPEWLRLDLMDVTLADVTELSDRFAFEMEDWPEVFYGREGEKPPKWQIHAAVWLALHQSGIATTWDEVGSVAILRVTYRSDEEPGKDDGSSDSPPSPTPEPSMTPPFSTSSPDSPEPS